MCFSVGKEVTYKCFYIVLVEEKKAKLHKSRRHGLDVCEELRFVRRDYCQKSSKIQTNIRRKTKEIFAEQTAKTTFAKSIIQNQH